MSDTFKAAHPEIPWRPIMAQRHRLAHEYGEIDDRLIWNVATVHVPTLIALIEPLTATAVPAAPAVPPSPPPPPPAATQEPQERQEPDGPRGS